MFKKFLSPSDDSTARPIILARELDWRSAKRSLTAKDGELLLVSAWPRNDFLRHASNIFATFARRRRTIVTELLFTLARASVERKTGEACFDGCLLDIRQCVFSDYGNEQ
jgi:hypothetical protein